MHILKIFAFFILWFYGKSDLFLETESPVVGLVLLHSRYEKISPTSFFVLKPYSKWLEQVNIRWIPMFMDEPEEETRHKLSIIDGLFFTGGAEPFYT